MSVADKILEMGYDDVVIFDCPSYDTAFIGVTNSNQAVYDYEKMVEYLMINDGMTYEEAQILLVIIVVIVIERTILSYFILTKIERRKGNG